MEAEKYQCLQYGCPVPLENLQGASDRELRSLLIVQLNLPVRLQVCLHPVIPMQ